MGKAISVTRIRIISGAEAGTSCDPRRTQNTAEGGRIATWLTHWEWQVELTPLGRSLVGDSSPATIVTNRPTMKEVTGITAGTDGSATAEFVWTSATTKAGDKLGVGDATGWGKASFRLYDDGWRLTDIQWCDSGPCK